MGLTLDDLGEKAGCSSATVSRVLNNSGPVSEDVRNRVMKVVRDTGYVPRRTRRQSTRRDSSVIQGKGLVEVILHRCTPMERLHPGSDGLVVEPSAKVDSSALLSDSYGLSSDFYMHIISGIMDELSSCKQKAILQVVDSLASPELRADINKESMRGVILLGDYSPDLDSFTQTCKRPLVLVDIIHRGRHDVVTIDNLAGITAAFDHVYALGHRDIGYVGAPFNASFRERRTTFEWKMAGAGLPVRPEWVYAGSEHIEDTAVGVEKILRLDARPTALLCANDWSAMGVLRAAERADVSVPSQLSVVGFDDVSVAQMVTPPLTTMSVPGREMGRQAVRQLFIGEHFDQSDRTSGCMIRMTPRLVERQSTAKVD